jgi:hypothetical protein
MSDKALLSRNLRTVGALAAVFVLPLLLSFWMYYGNAWRPVGRTNHGELIEPARPLPSAPENLFKDKWTLAYIGDGACDEACRESLYFMRQTRLALNNEMTRVSRVFLATGNCCDREFLEREHAGLTIVDAGGRDSQELLHAFPLDARPHSLFIVDPLGNLIMRYDTREDPKGLLQDLKKLLKLSHIG